MKPNEGSDDDDDDDDDDNDDNYEEELEIKKSMCISLFLSNVQDTCRLESNDLTLKIHLVKAVPNPKYGEKSLSFCQSVRPSVHIFYPM